MRISLCIALIALSTTHFTIARPLMEDGVVVATSTSIEWTDLMPSNNNNKNDMDTGSSNYYKEFEHAADQEIRKQADKEQGRANDDKPNTQVNLNQEAMDSNDKKTTHGQLNSQTTTTAKQISNDKNSISSSDTKYAFDIIMKPKGSEAQEPRTSDTTLMDDAGTRNAFSKNELATSDTTDYANRHDVGLPVANRLQDEQAPWAPSSSFDRDHQQEEETERDDDQQEEEEEEEETSSRFDFFDALDEALLDPYISGIDSDLNSEVYEAPVTETTTWEVETNGDIPDYVSLISEQIRSAEQEISIKHDELIQDQQQIDDLKRKIHHSSTTSLPTTTSPTFTMEVIESGPDETMYVYKHIPLTPTNNAQQQQQQQADLGTFVTHSPFLPPTQTPDLETDQQELRAEQNVPSAAVIHNNITPFYNLVQKQTDEEDYYQTKIKKGSAKSEAVDVVIPPSGGGTIFDPSKKLKLPNGSWTPSCKNVSKGLYCLQPDGQGSTIMECSGENVGFQFSCGKNLLCYSTGPFDVDCQKAQDFIKDE